jgi:membrane-bound lytic murein transglycosylase D
MKKWICCFLLCMLSMSWAHETLALPIPLEYFREAPPRRTRAAAIPVESNALVRRWIDFYTVNDRARFNRFMQRGALYKVLIEDILIENGVPTEMYYLAMIESGFARKARSHASAVGIWQFGAATAKLYGLRVDREVDERLDVIRATRAAARHLAELREEFGSWNLAMAAYNCGVGCVRRAVRRGMSNEFWYLARRRLLPTETVNYIPKFQAAMQIGRAPERYGFSRKAIYNFPLVERVRVPSRIKVGELARRHGVPESTLVAFNLHLVRGHTPSSPSGYEIWVPRRKRAGG